jgi:superfamily II DNA/RNA helicase
MQLINLGFKVVSLRSSQDQEERAKQLYRFNYDQDVQILLFNTKLGATSLNLHIGGHRIIGCEMPVNMATWLQVVGRVCRVGQKHEQTIYLVWLTDSYDQILLHKLCKKFVSTFAGEGSILCDSEDVVEKAQEVFQKFFGLKYSPYDREWGDYKYTNKYKWIEDFEKKRLAVSDGQEEYDNNDDMVTPTKSRNPQPFVPESSAKQIGKDRQHRAGKYGANVLIQKAKDSLGEGKLAIAVR